MVSPASRGGLVAVALAASWLVVLGAVLGVVHLPRLVGWEPRVVVSASMSPALSPGDVVLLAPVDETVPAEIGNIVAVRSAEAAGGVVVHRLVGHDPSGALLTRGDANDSLDHPPSAPAAVIGRVAVVVPGVGRPGLAARDGNVAPVLAIGALAGCAVAALGWGRRESGARASIAPAPGDSRLVEEPR